MELPTNQLKTTGASLQEGWRHEGLKPRLHRPRFLDLRGESSLPNAMHGVQERVPSPTAMYGTQGETPHPQCPTGHSRRDATPPVPRGGLKERVPSPSLRLETQGETPHPHCPTGRSRREFPPQCSHQQHSRCWRHKCLNPWAVKTLSENSGPIEFRQVVLLLCLWFAA